MTDPFDIFNQPVVNPFSESEDDKLLPIGTIQIFEYLDNLMKKRDPRTYLSASSMSKCVRSNWYQVQGLEGEAINPRAGLVFIQGDVTEHTMKHIMSESLVGNDRLYSEIDFGDVVGEFTIQYRSFKSYQQETVIIPMGANTHMYGHADGWGKRNSDGEWELIEIKSSASYGFDRFKNGETPDYIKQAHALMMSIKAKNLGVKSARFFYMNKNTSHVFDRLYRFDKTIAMQVIDEFLKATAEIIPDRPYKPVDETYYKKPTGRSILPWQCGYCSYTKTCWPEFKREINKGKPVWVLNK